MNQPTTHILRDKGYFTQEEAETNKSLVNENLYPHLYGEKLFKPLKLKDRSVLVNIDDIVSNPLGEPNVNTAWATDGNLKLPQIRKSIENFGFRLTYPPIALFRGKSGKLQKINGRTRNIVFEEWDYPNRICDIYEGDWDNYNQSQISDAISK